MAAAAGVLAVLCWPLPRDALDWQPGRFGDQPWRAVTAAFVHLSRLHLGANVAGTLLVGLLGRFARVGWPSVAAWLVAWPLTQAALLMQPTLLHYAGLSGVLHAGVAVVAVHLVIKGAPAERWIGAALVVGLLAKIGLEAPWVHVVSHPPGWDIAVAPLAHATGMLAGLVAALAFEAVHVTGRRRNPASI